MNKVTKMMMMSNKANKNRQMDYEPEDYGRESIREGRRMPRTRNGERYGRNYDAMKRPKEGRREYQDGYMSGYNYDRREMPRERREEHSREDWDDMDDDGRHEACSTFYDPKEWAKNMKNSDGSSGAHWSMEDTETVRKARNINDCNPEDFWIAMNMMYSDYQGVAKKYGIDKPEFYADMARGFLTDKDSKQGREKLEAYYEYVVH